MQVLNKQYFIINDSWKWINKHDVLFCSSQVLSSSACCLPVHSELFTAARLSSSQCLTSDDYACCFWVLLFICFMRPTVNSWVSCVSQWTASSFSLTPPNSASSSLTGKRFPWHTLCSFCLAWEKLDHQLRGDNYIQHSWWRADCG